MAKLRIGINGFGRIGRQVTKSMFENYRGQFDLVAVNDLSCSEADKGLLRAALCHAGADIYVAENPWFLAPLAEYEFTAIGHVIGKRKEVTAVVTGHPYGGVAVPVETWVNDYGISRADLATYVARVNARKTLPAF